VGTGGTILHFNGKKWAQEASPSDATLFAVTASSDGVVRAVGEQGVVLYKRE
jgi:hypothetical protein